MEAPSLADILGRHTERLLAVPGVIGTAEGMRGGRACVLVLVAHRTPAMDSAIPGQLEEVPVLIVESEAPEAFGPG